MTYYYIALQTRSHAFLLEQRLKMEGVPCELIFTPRELMRELCNMGVKIRETELARTMQIIRRSGLPGIRLFKETVYPNRCQYVEIPVN